MRQRITIILSVLVLLLVVGIMVKDMFDQKELTSNPYEYTIDDYKHIDEADFCYEKLNEISDSFKKLKALSVDTEDNLIIADSATVNIFNNVLEEVIEFEVGEEISSIHAGMNDLLIIALFDNIEIWDRKGKMIREWQGLSDRSIITSIETSEDIVFVADAGMKLIHLYDFGGNFIRSIGAKDSIDRKFGFMIPSPYFDIDLSGEGLIWATNPGLHTLEAFDNNGRYRSGWNKTSMGLDGFSGCCNPIHFALLSDGGFVTSEKGLVRVKIHDPTGDFRCAVEGPLSFDEKETGLDIAVNSNDDIFVMVPSEQTVRMYRRKR